MNEISLQSRPQEHILVLLALCSSTIIAVQAVAWATIVLIETVGIGPVLDR